MDDGYRLQKYKTPGGNSFWELVGPSNDVSSFSKMMSTPSKQECGNQSG